MKILGAVAVVAALVACAEPTVRSTPLTEPDNGSLMMGNKSMGPHADTVRGTMRQPLVVLVTDPAGVPVPGVVVQWEAFDGAAVSARSVPTDAGGESAVSLTLGAFTGTYRARAHVSGASGSPVDFAASAHPGSPVSLEKANGDGLEVHAGASVVHTVRVTDSHGNPVHGVRIEWAAEDGGSTFRPSSYTNKRGLAEMTCRTGARSSLLRVTARAPTLPASPLVTFMTRVNTRFSRSTTPLMSRGMIP